MAWHPINLTARFMLELGALDAFGYWGWTQHSDPLSGRLRVRGG